jgi:hypothetical protein
MKRNNFFIITAISLSALAVSCSSASAPAETNANANTATLQAASNTNPIAGNTAAPSPATNSAVAGIPNAPADLKVSKDDPTKNAKVQTMSNPAPDNSEITISLGQFPVETRTFKNNPQLAKVERIQDVANKKNIIKVYLKNGQVKEIAENAVQNPMAAPAAEILKAAEGGQPAKPLSEEKAPAPDQKPEKKLPPTLKQQ